MDVLKVSRFLVKGLEPVNGSGNQLILSLENGVFLCCEGDILRVQGDGAYRLLKELRKGTETAGARLLVERVEWP